MYVLNSLVTDMFLFIFYQHSFSYIAFYIPGTLDLKYLFHRDTMRWSLAAHDICFTNVFHSYFFMLGKCIPVIRGEGVYQVCPLLLITV